MDVFEQAIGVVQNNVSNASSPGYVTQTLNLDSLGFNPAGNLWGGVQAGSTTSARNSNAEEAVWTQNEMLGTATAQASSLASLQSAFDVTGDTGVPAALNGLYAAFSAWSTSPDDVTTRQQVLAAAQGVTQAFNQTASSIEQVRSQTDRSLQSTVDEINQLTGQIAAMNGQIRNGAGHDAGLNAQLYNTLEQLSNLASISVRTESDGTATVLLDGQAALVVGQKQTQLQLSYQSSGNVNLNAAPAAHILTSEGQDVTPIVTQGHLAGLLQFRNTTLPSVIGDGQQQGSLNQLAQGVADTVNGLLASGSGIPLFTYSSGSATAVAASLSVNPAITGPQLVAGTSTAANGIADQLAQLATAPALTVNGVSLSFTDFYSNTAAAIGAQASNASAAQQTQTQLLTQVQSMRAQVSGVSLNEQATQLLQFQQAYEASAQLISIISSTTNYLMSAMQQVA